MRRRPSPIILASPPAWPPRKSARAAYLAGRGWSAEAIAGEPAVNETPRAVREHLGTLGIRCRADAPPEQRRPTLLVPLCLTREERIVLGQTASRAELYLWAAAALIVRTVLKDGESAVERLLKRAGR